MAKRKFKVGDPVIWNDEKSEIISILKDRATIQTEKSKQLGYPHITSVNVNELKLIKIEQPEVVSDEA